MLCASLLLTTLLTQQPMVPPESPMLFTTSVKGENIDGLLAELESATTGLTYISEQDHPLDPFAWRDFSGTLNRETVCRLTGHQPDEPVEIVDFDWFFRNAVRDDLYGPEAAARFRALKQLMRENLTNLKVYRVGRISLDVYVVGRTRGGTWMGLHTKVIET